MADTKKTETSHGGRYMWPSLETASHIFDWAGFVLIGALTLGVVSTVLIVWMGIVKEHHWDDEKRQSAERISINEKETKRAVAESDKAKEGAALANERAAEANAKALEAQLALEKFKAPRQFSPDETAKLIEFLTPFSGQEFQVTTYWEAKEPMEFTKQLVGTLMQSGWKVIPHARWAGLLGGVEGVTAYVHPDAGPAARAARDALVAALRGMSFAADSKEEGAVNNPKHDRINIKHRPEATVSPRYDAKASSKTETQTHRRRTPQAIRRDGARGRGERVA